MIALFLAFGLPAAPEWTFIGVLALILFGPKKLPGLARGCAKVLAEFQKAKEEFEREILQIPELPQIKEPLEKKVFSPQQPSSDLTHVKKEPPAKILSGSKEPVSEEI
jgi:TatA/E family protein of Tat protein translocase